MGDVLIKQTIAFTASKNPGSQGAAITEKDFEISPAEQIEVTDFSETASGRFNIAASASLTLGFGTLALAKVLVLKPDSDANITLTNANGTSQVIKVLGGKSSVLWGELTGVQITNPSSTAALKGRFFLGGD